MDVVSKRNMMAKAHGKKTPFAYGQKVDVSKEEAKVYLHRKWCLTPDQAKKEKIFPVESEDKKK